MDVSRRIGVLFLEKELDRRTLRVTRDALRGHTVSKNGTISFYAGCPEGAYRV